MGKLPPHEGDASVSIVIVNKDDPGVADTLVSLRSIIETMSAEVIVVDASRGRLDEVRQRFPWATWIDYVHHTDKPRTIAEQRNVGVRAANGEIVIFLDAGCVPSVNWSQALLRPIKEDGESVVSGGVASKGGKTLHDRPRASGVSPEALYLSECSTMNLAVSADVFDTVGPFDEGLGFAEDVDFAWRAVSAGFRLRFAEDAIVTHDWGSVSPNVERALRYGVARVRLYRKHPRELRRLAGPDFSVAAYTLYVAFVPVAFFSPWYLLLLVVPLLRNRGRRPVSMLAYQLCYGVGVLSELLHVPILRGQRRRYVTNSRP